MANITLKDICKTYSNGVSAVDRFNLEIGDKEFIIFVGPSGCGKSTTLRMIAGLEDITAGELTIDGGLMNDVPARDRDVAMVFQSYALYPHMTIYDNIAFGLRRKKLSKAELDAKVQEAARILDLESQLKKKPKELSGGQKQRVASARAIITNPKLVLADEPTGALDSKSAKMLLERFHYLNRDFLATILMVTHDAFTASYASRVIFIKDGKIFNELLRAGRSRKEFFDEIIDVVTMLGGDLNDAL